MNVGNNTILDEKFIMSDMFYNQPKFQLNWIIVYHGGDGQAYNSKTHKKGVL